eukprot:scaffold111778_cov43-Prasinocladus_malaysianus.AAC.1
MRLYVRVATLYALSSRLVVCARSCDFDTTGLSPAGCCFRLIQAPLTTQPPHCPIRAERTTLRALYTPFSMSTWNHTYI